MPTSTALTRPRPSGTRQYRPASARNAFSLTQAVAPAPSLETAARSVFGLTAISGMARGARRSSTSACIRLPVLKKGIRCAGFVPVVKGCNNGAGTAVEVSGDRFGPFQEFGQFAQIARHDIRLGCMGPGGAVAVQPGAAQPGGAGADDVHQRVVADVQHFIGRQVQAGARGMKDLDRGLGLAEGARRDGKV